MVFVYKKNIADPSGLKLGMGDPCSPQKDSFIEKEFQT